MPPDWRIDDKVVAASDLHLAPSEQLPNVRSRSPFDGVLSQRQASILELSLPRNARGREWCRLYHLKQHGASLNTLLRRSRGRNPTLLCVRTSREEVIGAFCPSPWWDSHLPLGVHEELPPLAGPNSDFFGYAGGAFVWSFAPEATVPSPYPCTPNFRKSAWGSDRNMQLQYLCVEPSKGGGVATSIGVGGGGKCFALHLDEFLEKGRTGPNLTFQSDALTSPQKNLKEEMWDTSFLADDVELWGFE